MDRRQFNTPPIIAIGACLAMAMRQTQALSLDDLSSADASKGLKTALAKGALSAVALLGKQDGFLGNDKVRIPLPGFLNDFVQLLRTLGMGDKVDELVITMNRAAEAAVAMAKELLLKAVQGMTVTDAKAILGGGNTAVTEFLVLSR